MGRATTWCAARFSGSIDERPSGLGSGPPRTTLSSVPAAPVPLWSICVILFSFSLAVVLLPTRLPHAAQEAAGRAHGGAMSDAEARVVVESLYRRILHREPDPAGLQIWTEALLRQGGDREWLERILLESEERKNLERRRRRKIAQIALVLAGLAVAAATAVLLQKKWPRAVGAAREWALVLLASLLLGEGALRAYHHFNPLFIFYDESYNRFRGKPHARDWNFTLNSMGFKDLDFSVEKGDRYRIAALGDSFAFGVVPYEFNYLTVLENIAMEVRPEVEILNMGIPSIGPEQYLNLLVREALPLEPDMVLLSFFVGNDFRDSRREERTRNLYSYSYIASLVRYAVSVRPQFDGWSAHGAEEYRDADPTFNEEKYLEIEKSRSFMFRRQDEKLPLLVEDSAHYLKEIRDICRKKGIELHVLVMPDEMQVSSDLQWALREKHYPEVPDGEWDWERPNTLLRARLNDLGIRHIDLLESFVAEGIGKRLYKPRDSHWNIAGNRLAASILSGYLAKHIQ